MRFGRQVVYNVYFLIHKILNVNVKYTCIAPILFTNIHRRFYDDEDDEMTMT